MNPLLEIREQISRALDCVHLSKGRRKMSSIVVGFGGTANRGKTLTCSSATRPLSTSIPAASSRDRGEPSPSESYPPRKSKFLVRSQVGWWCLPYLVGLDVIRAAYPDHTSDTMNPHAESLKRSLHMRLFFLQEQLVGIYSTGIIFWYTSFSTISLLSVAASRSTAINKAR